MMKITKKLTLLVVSILFCFAFFPIGVSAEELPEDAVPVTSVETETNSLPEETASEEVSSDLSEETPATFSADPDEAKTFNDYFPDPNFARVVAKELGKTPEQLTSKAELERIRYLTAGKQGITSLEGIENLRCLYELYIGNNPIKTLPDSFCNLSELKILYLSGSNITELPENFGNLSQLERFNCRETPPSKLPESMAIFLQ